jgi:hypothetical protein
LESNPNTVKILGVLITRNQWPLVGLCITHALTNHVDHLIVVDHASTDQTKSGLRELKNRWGSRLEVLNMSDGIFFHEEVNLVLKSFYEERDFDWVYPIDSDEFLITKDDAPLRELLSELPIEIDLIRYNVVNFVAPVDFDENRLDRYQELVHRSVCNPNLVWDKSNPFEANVKGEVNFFQVPFDSKVIFRFPITAWPTAGAHSLTGQEEIAEKKLREDYLFAAHLPFLTRERLQRRADHGRDLAAAGYPMNFGWQSQVVHHFGLQNKLDEYWDQVSMPANGLPKFFQTSIDTRLSKLLTNAAIDFEPTFTTLKNDLKITESVVVSVLNAKHAVAAVRTISELQQRSNLAAQKEIRYYANRVEAINSENQSLEADNSDLLAENELIKTEIANLLVENELIKLENESSKTQNANLQVEHELIKTERAILLAENASIKRSLSWRLTKILRIIHSQLSYFK